MMDLKELSSKLKVIDVAVAVTLLSTSTPADALPQDASTNARINAKAIVMNPVNFFIIYYLNYQISSIDTCIYYHIIP